MHLGFIVFTPKKNSIDPMKSYEFLGVFPQYEGHKIITAI